MFGAKQVRRAPSLYQWKTLIEANSTKAPNESNLDIPDLKRDKSIKELVQEIKNVKRDKEAYMQDMLESTHRDSVSTDSI